MSALDPQAAALLGPIVGGLPPEILRDGAAARRYLELARPSVTREQVDRVEQVASVTTARTPSGRELRVYRPDRPAGPPCLYLHGGGWVLGNLDMHDELCRRLANRARVVVANLDYRLAPEHPFPAALDDCSEALSWLRRHADASAIGDGVIVAGSSAGGNLAAALALRCRDEGREDVALQVLIYPALDWRMDTASWREWGDGPVLTAEHMRWYWQQYAPRPADGALPLVSPAQAADLRGLPPAVVLVGDCDPLRDEARQFAQRLADAGVSADFLLYEGQTHSFLRHLDKLAAADRALADIVQAVQSVQAAQAGQGMPGVLSAEREG